MNIKELTEAKKQLEANLYQSVSELYNKFKEDTGVSPDYIIVDVNHITRIGYKPEGAVGNVRVEITL